LGEQRRIRAFVDDRQSSAQQQSINLHNAIQRRIQKMEDHWGCRIAVQSITQKDSTVTNEVINQIELLVAESVSNAVQHGNASHINITIEKTSGHVQLRIADNGLGLPGTLGTYSQAELAAQGIGPQSIVKRVTELRGTLSLSSSRNGVEIRVKFPVEGQVRNISDREHAFG